MASSAKLSTIVTRRPRFSRLYPSINTRIIAPFLFVILIIASIGMFLMTRLVAGSLQERLTNQLIDSANAASASLVDMETQQLATLRLLTLTEGVPAAIHTQNIADLEHWLRPLMENARIDSMIVFDQTGSGLLNIQNMQNVSVGDHYQTADPPFLGNWNGVQKVLQSQADSLGDKFIDIIGQPSTATSNSMIYISAPVRDTDGHVVGGISVGMQGDHLAQRASEQALSAVVLLTESGELIGSAFRAPASTVKALGTDSAQLLQTVDNESPVRSVEVDGIAYQVLYTRFRERSQSVGLLGVALPSNLILDRSGFGRNIFGVLFGVLFFAVGALGVLASRTITRPVTHLVGVTRAIRSGDLTRRAGLRMPDELGELSESFDRMTEMLVQQNAEISTLYFQQLRETLQHNAILRSISDAVIVQDAAGQLILRNASADQLVAAVMQSTSARAEFESLCANPERFIYGGSAAPADAPLLAVNFAGRFFSVIASAIYMPATPNQKAGGFDLLGYVLIFRDVTPLLEAERLKEQLILQMSHELRTPLTAARGYVDLVSLLGAASLDEQAGSFLHHATESLDTLERLINTVIDVSTVVSGRFQLDLEVFDLATLLDARANDWQPAIAAREQTLTRDIATQPILINADHTRLASVIDHLLRNANSYTLPGGQLTLTAYRENETAVITVSDTGVGIGADEIDHVFDQLYRGHAADAGLTDARGLGLGLFLSRRIIETHHGQITLRSNLGVGTTATVRLPLNLPVEIAPPPMLQLESPRA